MGEEVGSVWTVAGRPDRHRWGEVNDHPDHLRGVRGRFKCLSDGEAFHFLADVGTEARSKWRKSDKALDPAGKKPSGQRATNGGRIAQGERQLSGSPVPLVAGTIGRSQGGQSHGPLLGMSDLSDAHQGAGSRRSWSCLLRTKTS